jgi:hypothetical protein
MPTNILPGFEGRNKAYELLLKREKRIKPSSVTFRHNILKKMLQSNYINEYDRILGELAPYASVFGKDAVLSKNKEERSYIDATHKRLTERQEELRRLFKTSHHEPRHEIYGTKK